MANAHNNLAIALVLRGDVLQAARHYETAIFLRPDYVEARYNPAVLYLAQGFPDLARSQAEKVMELDPGFRSARQLLLSLGGR